MDTDVMIFANLEELWQIIEANPDVLFHWVSSLNIVSI